MPSVTKQKTRINTSKFQKSKKIAQNNQTIFSKVTKVTKTIKAGNIYTVKISALTSNNLGLNEFTYGFPILIGGVKEANANLGDVVQVKVLKVKKVQAVAQKTYAIAKITKVVKKSNKLTANSVANKIDGFALAKPTVGQTLDVTIIGSKAGLKGTYIAELAGNYKLLINTTQSLTVGQKVSVQVTRVKQTYGFAKLTQTANTNSGVAYENQKSNALTSIKEGTKFTLVLPKKAKRYLKNIVIKLNTNFDKKNGKKVPTILFVKPVAGAKLGDKVQIQITKSFQSKTANVVIGKIYKINPLSPQSKKAILRTSIQSMLNSGMHYGEQAIKCNARMKQYVFSSYASSYASSVQSPRSSSSTQNSNVLNNTNGVASKSWNTLSSKATTFGLQRVVNKPLIKKGRNIINLFKTRRCLNKALAQLTKYAAKGKTFLFVGTKKAASGLIARASLFSKKAFFVNTRWLGGMLTNWKTILKSISKIRPILKEKQVIIKDILAKRQSIKTLLMEKAFLLKKKSKLVLKKGRQLLQKLKTPLKASFSITEKAQQLIAKRKEFMQKGQVLLEKRQLILQKRKQVITQSQALFEKAIVITNNSKEYLNKATIIRKKLREFKALLVVSQQLQALQQTAKKQNKDLYTVSYNQSKQFSNAGYVIPNPPKDILNKMILFIKQNSLATTNISKKDATSKSTVVIFTKLLSQFSSFAPAIKLSIKTLLTSLKEIQAKLNQFQTTLKVIVEKMQQYATLKNTIISQLRQIKTNLINQRNIIRIVKRKLKQLAAQKRLIKFLPRLRYLPTPSVKIAETVQVLMKKIVDPKLKYPIDAIYEQKLSTQSKKVAAMRKKKWQRLEKYLGGISNMRSNKFNSASGAQIRNTVAIIIGQQEEMNAVRECQKLGIKMFHVVDTNCNPGFADHFIPANDDSRNSIKFILTQFLTRIRLAQKLKKAYSLKPKALN
jgi:small subunit ribosomal protein S2